MNQNARARIRKVKDERGYDVHLRPRWAQRWHVKRIISTPDAPEAVGPYSQGTTDGSLVFTAGQVPVTPDGESLVDEPIDVQTRQCLENVRNVLEEEGLSMQDVLKVTVFLDDIDEFEDMNSAYAEYFQDNPPARSAVEVANVPLGASVEIEAIAAIR